MCPLPYGLKMLFQDEGSAFFHCHHAESFEFLALKPPSPLTPPATRKYTDLSSEKPIPFSQTIHDFKNPDILLRPAVKK